MFHSRVITIHKNIMDGTLYWILYRGNTNTKMKPHGFGVYFYFGDVYLGNFRNGRKHGYGIWKCRGGYRPTKFKYSYVQRGIYIGIFCHDQFVSGKFIKSQFHPNCFPYGYQRYTSRFQNTPFRCPTQHLTVHYFQNIEHGKYHSKGTQNLSGYIQNKMLHGNFYIQNYSPSFHAIIPYRNSCLHGRGVHIRFSEKNVVLYKILTEWVNDQCVMIHCLYDDDNLLFYPFHYFEQNNPRIHFDHLCPIERSMMMEPCRTEYNTTYDLKNLMKWISKYKKPRDPLTNLPYTNMNFEIDYKLQESIFDCLWTTCFPKQILGTLPE